MKGKVLGPLSLGGSGVLLHLFWGFQPGYLHSININISYTYYKLIYIYIYTYILRLLRVSVWRFCCFRGLVIRVVLCKSDQHFRGFLESPGFRGFEVWSSCVLGLVHILLENRTWM